MYAMNMNIKFKKEKKWISIAYSIHPRLVQLLLSLSLLHA